MHTGYCLFLWEGVTWRIRCSLGVRYVTANPSIVFPAAEVKGLHKESQLLDFLSDFLILLYGESL